MQDHDDQRVRSIRRAGTRFVHVRLVVPAQIGTIRARGSEGWAWPRAPSQDRTSRVARGVLSREGQTTRRERTIRTRDVGDDTLASLARTSTDHPPGRGTCCNGDRQTLIDLGSSGDRGGDTSTSVAVRKVVRMANAPVSLTTTGWVHPRERARRLLRQEDEVPIDIGRSCSGAGSAAYSQNNHLVHSATGPSAWQRLASAPYPVQTPY
jgi:hypothetical protein